MLKFLLSSPFFYQLKLGAITIWLKSQKKSPQQLYRAQVKRFWFNDDQRVTLHEIFHNVCNITWPHGDTNFIFECCWYLSRVSAVNEWEISPAWEDKIRITKGPCNVLFTIWLLMKHPHLRHLYFVFILEVPKTVVTFTEVETAIENV